MLQTRTQKTNKQQQKPQQPEKYRGQPGFNSLKYSVVVSRRGHERKQNKHVTKLNFNPLTPRVKPWVIQSFLTFDSMDRTLKCDHSLQRCWAVLYPVCNFGKFINFGLGTVRNERVNIISNVECYRKQKGRLT